MCGIWQLFSRDHNNHTNNNNNITTITNTITTRYQPLYDSIRKRGPDMTSVDVNVNGITVFHRLAINDVTNKGMQPFNYEYNNNVYSLICNGEIYNHKQLEDITPEYTTISNSDCEILLPYFVHHCKENATMFFNDLLGEFSMIITKTKSNNHTNNNPTTIIIGTDPMSVRPLFYRHTPTELIVSSLLSGFPLSTLSTPSNHTNHHTAHSHHHSYHSNKRLEQGEYRIYTQTNDGIQFETSTIYHPLFTSLNMITSENDMLYDLLISTLKSAVERRLMSDKPYCCLLSGGFDSLRVATLAQLCGQSQLHTFTIGMKDGSDLHYARECSRMIGTHHTEVLFTESEALSCIPDVIRSTETFDITTIRASVPQYLLAKYISENTDFKVVLNGDGADEIEMGYLYFYLSPNDIEAQQESKMLVENISKFDGLRVDRCMSSFGLEARVPFEDIEYVDLYSRLSASLKRPTNDRMEKHLSRVAFEKYINEKTDVKLTHDIIFRKKEAFSDGVSSNEKSWYQMTSDHGKNMISDDELYNLQKIHSNHLPPYTHEGAYYRKIFDSIFGVESEKCIPRIWLPNWTDEKDPSARKLKCY
jgi:asparagine synthase (glutamine-hydrolysing)